MTNLFLRGICGRRCAVWHRRCSAHRAYPCSSASELIFQGLPAVFVSHPSSAIRTSAAEHDATLSIQQAGSPANWITGSKIGVSIPISGHLRRHSGFSENRV